MTDTGSRTPRIVVIQKTRWVDAMNGLRTRAAVPRPDVHPVSPFTGGCPVNDDRFWLRTRARLGYHRERVMTSGRVTARLCFGDRARRGGALLVAAFALWMPAGCGSGRGGASGGSAGTGDTMGGAPGGAGAGESPGAAGHHPRRGARAVLSARRGRLAAVVGAREGRRAAPAPVRPAEAALAPAVAPARAAAKGAPVARRASAPPGSTTTERDTVWPTPPAPRTS